MHIVTLNIFNPTKTSMRYIILRIYKWNIIAHQWFLFALPRECPETLVASRQGGVDCGAACMHGLWHLPDFAKDMRPSSLGTPQIAGKSSDSWCGNDLQWAQTCLKHLLQTLPKKIQVPERLPWNFRTLKATKSQFLYPCTLRCVQRHSRVFHTFGILN